MFLLSSLGAFAQTISATFFNLPQQKVYLNACKGLYLEVVDSVMMSQDKRVEFNSVLTKGMSQARKVCTRGRSTPQAPSC